MKKIIYSIFIFAICATTFQSCDSDDDNSTSVNFDDEVSINGEAFNLDGAATLESYGQNTDGSFDWDVDIAGTNVNVYFDLNTSSENGLVEGTYTYSSERQEFTYVDAYIEILDNTDSTSYEPTEGTIVITIDGDVVGITFNLTEGDNSIQGEWSGTLTLVD